MQKTQISEGKLIRELIHLSSSKIHLGLSLNKPESLIREFPVLHRMYAKWKRGDYDSYGNSYFPLMYLFKSSFYLQMSILPKLFSTSILDGLLILGLKLLSPLVCCPLIVYTQFIQYLFHKLLQVQTEII